MSIFAYNGTATPAINNASETRATTSTDDPRLAATVLYNGVNWVMASLMYSNSKRITRNKCQCISPDYKPS